jgi:hypothetical protein
MSGKPLTLAAISALLLTLTATTASAAGDRPHAHATRSVAVSERADLHLVRKSGSTLYEAGTATGTLPGTITARFTVTSKVTGSVRITTRGGTLTMSVDGTPRSAGTIARFGGTMRVTSGTGKFARASGTATFTGTVNRRTWAATVNATGRLTY